MPTFDELAQQVANLQERINELENTTRPENIDVVDDELILNTSEVNSAQVTRTASGSTSGSVDVLDYPDKWLLRRHKGIVYLVPAYNYSKK